MIIQFKYKLPQALANLANKEITDFNDEYVYGWLDQMDAGQLKHCSLYMVCELETYDKLDVLRNPTVVVACNDIQALEIFSKATNKVNGTVMCEILNNCEKIFVEPTGTMV